MGAAPENPWEFDMATTASGITLPVTVWYDYI